MKGLKRLFLAVSVFVFFLSLGTASADTWAKTYDSGHGGDVAYSIQLTADGGYIAAGVTNPYVGGDILALKLDSSGNVEWQKTYGGMHEESSGFDPLPDSVQQAADGGYIIVGYTLSFGAGISDAWVLKLSASGNIEWQKTYGSINNDFAYSVQQTVDGGYIVAGATIAFNRGAPWVLKLDASGNIEWQKIYSDGYFGKTAYIHQTGDGGYVLAGGKNNDVWVLKLNTIGNIEWQKTYGGANGEHAYSIRQTSDNGFIVAGATDSFGADSYDPWILKLDSKGNIEWQKVYNNGTALSHDRAHSVRQTTDGGYVIAGAFGLTGSTDIHDAFILKLDASGNVDWQKTYDGGRGEFFYSVRQTSNGGYIVAGLTNSFSVSTTDALVLKLDSAGNISGCPAVSIEEVNAALTDTNAIVGVTDVTAQDTYVFPVVSNAVAKDTNEIFGEVCAVSNQPPIANAGPDQTIELRSCSGITSTPVTLDGSASYDPDGDALSYLWTWNGGSATGVRPTISVPSGTTTVALTVDDGKGGIAQAQDTVAITVTTITADGLMELIRQMYASGQIESQGIANSLIAKLKNGSVQAFINEVNAQAGKHIEQEAALMMINAGTCLN